MEKEDKKVNMSIEDGKSFFAHEVSINFNPSSFILDFKNVTPRVDPRSKDNLVLRMEHNVVMVDPYHAKKMLELFSRVVKDYESEYGKIEKPKAIKKHEQKAKKHGKKAEAKKTKTTPSYFG